MLPAHTTPTWWGPEGRALSAPPHQGDPPVAVQLQGEELAVVRWDGTSYEPITDAGAAWAAVLLCAPPVSAAARRRWLEQTLYPWQWIREANGDWRMEPASAPATPTTAPQGFVLGMARRTLGVSGMSWGADGGVTDPGLVTAWLEAMATRLGMALPAIEVLRARVQAAGSSQPVSPPAAPPRGDTPPAPRAPDAASADAGPRPVAEPFPDGEPPGEDGPPDDLSMASPPWATDDAMPDAPPADFFFDEDGGPPWGDEAPPPPDDAVPSAAFPEDARGRGHRPGGRSARGRLPGGAPGERDAEDVEAWGRRARPSKEDLDAAQLSMFGVSPRDPSIIFRAAEGDDLGIDWQNWASNGYAGQLWVFRHLVLQSLYDKAALSRSILAAVRCQLISGRLQAMREDELRRGAREVTPAVREGTRVLVTPNGRRLWALALPEGDVIAVREDGVPVRHAALRALVRRAISAELGVPLPAPPSSGGRPRRP